VGRDGEGYRSDLGWARRGIFLRTGLDRKESAKHGDLPDRRTERGRFAESYDALKMLTRFSAPNWLPNCYWQEEQRVGSERRLGDMAEHDHGEPLAEHANSNATFFSRLNLLISLTGSRATLIPNVCALIVACALAVVGYYNVHQGFGIRTNDFWTAFVPAFVMFIIRNKIFSYCFLFLHIAVAAMKLEVFTWAPSSLCRQPCLQDS
jgi:hypothetical protein